jgi:hypothetical protein
MTQRTGSSKRSRSRPKTTNKGKWLNKAVKRPGALLR